jgi:ATP-dependent DNA helicase RecG
VLLYQTPLSNLGRERLQILRDSQDGFVIAEKDLSLRGPGEVLGTRQTGDISFRMADLLRDQHLLEPARLLAEHLMQDNARLEQALLQRWVAEKDHYATV